MRPDDTTASQPTTLDLRGYAGVIAGRLLDLLGAERARGSAHALQRRLMDVGRGGDVGFVPIGRYAMAEPDNHQKTRRRDREKL